MRLYQRIPQQLVVPINLVTSLGSFGAFGALRSEADLNPLRFQFIQHLLAFICLFLTVWKTGVRPGKLFSNGFIKWKVFLFPSLCSVLGAFFEDSVYLKNHDLGFCLSFIAGSAYLEVLITLFCSFCFKEKPHEAGDTPKDDVPRTLVASCVAGVFAWTRQDQILFIGTMINSSLKSAFATGVSILASRRSYFSSQLNAISFVLCLLAYKILILYTLTTFTCEPSKLFHYFDQSVHGFMDLVIVVLGSVAMILSLLSDYWLLLHSNLHFYLFLQIAKSSGAYILWYTVYEFGSWYLLTPLNLMSNSFIIGAFVGFTVLCLKHRPQVTILDRKFTTDRLLSQMKN